MTEQRRLAAIVSADVAGYSRLMGRDESGTLAALKALRREIVDPRIAMHNGRIVKTTGDGLLLEFASVVDAVRCVIEVQTAVAARVADVPEERRIAFRIGLNVGDIIVDGDDIFGDGVNIAARLQEMATPPGGVCISSRAHDDVRDRLDATFERRVQRTVNLERFARFACGLIFVPMAHPVCSLCSHPRRAEIDAALLGGLSTAAVAKKYGGQQTTFARHLRLHLKPHVHAIARAAGPMMLSPPTPEAQIAQVIPTVAAVLADLGHTVERLKTLADDAERDGGLGMRAVSLREPRAGLTDTAKLLAVLRPPDTPPPEQVDRAALADLIASTDTDSRQAILDKLVP